VRSRDVTAWVRGAQLSKGRKAGAALVIWWQQSWASPQNAVTDNLNIINATGGQAMTKLVDIASPSGTIATTEVNLLGLNSGSSAVSVLVDNIMNTTISGTERHLSYYMLGQQATGGPSINRTRLTSSTSVPNVFQANTNGVVTVPFSKSGTVTVGNLVCMTAANTVTNCTTASGNFVGVAVSSSSGGVVVATQGIVNVNIPSFNVALGDFICQDSTTGQAKDNGVAGACTALGAVGIPMTSGTALTSVPVMFTRF
jgi:hypothetical protein